MRINYRILKWSILIISWLITIACIPIIIIYANEVFNYMYLALATIIFTLSIWYIFKQTEDGLVKQNPEGN